MRFTERDLTNQYISSSYQDVVQQYVPTGSTVYLLDGYGYSILAIPSSSYGQPVLTQDQTASVAITASFTKSASFSETASFASWVASSSFALSASWAPAVPTTTAISSSWASSSLSSSHAQNSTLALIADVALLADTASVAVLSESSSWSTNTVTSSGVFPFSVKTINYTLTTADYTVIMSGSTNLTAALPTAIGNFGRSYNIKNVTPTTVLVSGSQNIDDVTYKLVTQWSNMTVVSNGTQWLII